MSVSCSLLRVRFKALMLFIGAALMSCNSPITELPEMPQRLVLNGAAENGKPWAIKLSVSQGILYNGPDERIENAKLSIYENGQLMETVTSLSVGGQGPAFNFANAVPIPGNTYRIEAAYKTLEPIYSTFVQPMPVPVDSVSVTILGRNPNPTIGTDIQLRVYIDDPPGPNYYVMTAKKQNEDGRFAQHLQLTFLDPAYEAESFVFDPNSVRYIMAFDDSKFDGKKEYFDFSSSYFNDRGDPSSIPLTHYAVFLQNLTKEYYEYLKAMHLQTNTRHDPFSQPVPVKGNVENGYGMFSGYTQTVKTLRE
jgi:Domain of unknown function (DUF4249)